MKMEYTIGVHVVSLLRTICKHMVSYTHLCIRTYVVYMMCFDAAL